MKLIHFLLLLFLLNSIGLTGFAQQDSAKKASGLEVNQYLAGKKPGNLVHVAFGGGLISGDWAKLYGNYGQVTVGFTHLFPSRLTLGIEGSILFGNKLRYDPVSSLRGPSQTVIGYDGNDAEIAFTMQGYRSPTVSLGRFFSLGERKRRNQAEHGFHVAVKGGALIHKTRIYDPTNTVALLDKTNRRGFDNLRAGPLVGLSASYWYIAPTGRYALFVAVEPFVAISRSQRSFNYNLGRAETQPYTDHGLLGQVGFSLLLFQLGEEQEFFYN